MLTDYLQQAIDDLDRLIELTALDIEDIKRARHESLFGRIEQKSARIESFERRKSMIDKTMVAMMRNNPGVELSELLDSETTALLTTLKERLNRLQELNRYYARFVIAVGEFYSAMFEEVLPTEPDGYDGKRTRAASLIEVRV